MWRANRLSVTLWEMGFFAGIEHFRVTVAHPGGHPVATVQQLP